MWSLWGCSFIMPIVGLFSGTMPLTSATAATCAKRMRTGVAEAAKAVANSTQVARAAIQRRSPRPAGG